jgi:methionine synthase II (cobalamin-independent)
MATVSERGVDGMKRSTEHVLTTHTGSLPRPPGLLEGLQRRDRGESNGAALEDQVRDAVQDVVGRQARAGVGVVNDGEASKIGSSMYVRERLERIRRYAQLVGRENVIAGSGCGFATFASLLAVDPGSTWAKLGAMADGARIASESVW